MDRPSTNAATRQAQSSAFFARPDYLRVSYSEKRCPKGRYPVLLARWLEQNVFGRKGRLLDLGCGRGDDMAAFAEIGFEVAGIDISPAAPEMAAPHRVEVADLAHDALPYAEASFDFVFSKGVLEHLHEPVGVMEKARSALKPGGTAVFMVPSWIHMYKDTFYADHTHVTPFMKGSLSKAMEIAGFEGVQVRYFRQLPFLWKYPFLLPLVCLVAALPLPYRPTDDAPWPDSINKLIHFGKQVMLLAVARRPL